MVSLEDVRRAAVRIEGRVLRTPVVHSQALSRRSGAEVWLKLENLQVTGAFKERGAANRLALLSDGERARGVIAMSAGNHAQAVARHAALLGVPSTIVMPVTTPATKLTRTARWGSKVVVHGETLAQAESHARKLAGELGLVFIHPYDDDAIIAGQGTLALELIEEVTGLDALLIPVGGGGLIAGAAVAALGSGANIETIGVEVEGYPAMAQALAGQPVDVGGPTIAEGIAVRNIGVRPLAIARKLVRRMLTVSEGALEDAIALLAEEAKVIAEGAGAAGVAALLTYPHLFAGRRVGIPICGANIDSRTLANILQRAMLRDGRLVRLVLDIPDRPGILGDIAMRIGADGANIVEVFHHRLFTVPSVKTARLEVVFEARDRAHSDAVTVGLQEHCLVALPQ